MNLMDHNKIYLKNKPTRTRMVVNCIPLLQKLKEKNRKINNRIFARIILAPVKLIAVVLLVQNCTWEIAYLLLLFMILKRGLHLVVIATNSVTDRRIFRLLWKRGASDDLSV